MSGHQVSAGGALVGLLATGSVLTYWYFKHGRKGGGQGIKGDGGGKGRQWIRLAPFAWAATLGVMSSLATGGAMGNTAVQVGISSNDLGNQLLSSLAGADAPAITRAGTVMLNGWGSICLVIVLLGVLIWLAVSKWGVRIQLLLGYVAGCTLGPTAGIAGIAGVVIAPLFNWIGLALVGGL
ncbi:hypothetical protein ACEZCY_14620 [Streptacidiphilus sp. N1-12]|uniref:Uncharacterized protein n=2 Tax=Streptacidiphilus alkalitolerans TaxID=3342712 RepID=A0ABV6V9T5_9ACTN